MASDSSTSYGMAMEAVVALAGSTAAGYFATGVDAMDLATSISGSAGATIGFVAGRYLEKQYSDSSYAMIFPIAGAIAVPGLAGGVWDANIVIMGVGAWAACKVYESYVVKA